jgi:N-methylhydantoinase A
VGERLGLDAGMAALGVVEMVDENMANAARVHAIESAKSYEGRAIIAFGGGGPVHGYRVAEKIGVKRMLVPSGAGVGSAIGFLRAPVAYEVVKSLYTRFASFDVAGVNALLAEMSAEAGAVVAGDRSGRRRMRGASPTCATSARGTRSRCRCPCGPWRRRTWRRCGRLMMPNTAGSMTGRCRGRMSRS